MSMIKGNIRQLGMVIALVVIAILFQGITGGLFFEHLNVRQAFQEGFFFRPVNILNLITQNGYILVLAIGMMLVIITGRVDLSVGSFMAFASAISGILMVSWGLPVGLSILIVLFVGALSGAWNGYWIAYKNIPFFVVTLAGMLIFRGLTMAVLEEETINLFPESFQNMAAGTIPDFLSGEELNLTAIFICALLAILFVLIEVLSRRSSVKYKVEVLPLPFFIVKLLVVVVVIALFGRWFALGRGFPNILILLVALIVIYSFVANKTVMGRHVYATGGDAKAAELSGIKVKRVVFWVYVNMGVLAALAGLVLTARLNAATPRAEAGFELQAIAASFIGGAGAYGGTGKITGAIIGAMVIGVLNNGLNHMGIGGDLQLAITGVVLLIAVIFDVYTKRTQV